MSDRARAPSGDGSAWCTLKLVDGHAERSPSLTEYLERLPLGIDRIRGTWSNHHTPES